MFKSILYLVLVLAVLFSSMLPMQWQVGNWEMGTREVSAGNTTTIQPDATAGLDTQLYEGAKTTNYGTDTILYTQSYSTTITHTIIELDLSSIPDGVTITAATLSLYYAGYLVNNPAGRTITIYHLQEGRSTWSESQATWNIYKTDNNWTTAGAYDTTNDIDTSISATATVPGSAGWMTSNALTLVNDAITNHSDKLRLKISDLGASYSTFTQYYSSDYSTDATKRPKITITYSYPVTVSTLTTTDITPAEATLNGNVTDDKSQTIDYQAFVWDTVSRADPGDLIPSSSLYANYWISSVGDYGEVAFDHLISCLSGNTTYYVRAVAHSAQYNTWSYGSEGNFTTDPSLFTIHTDSYASVTQVRPAIVNGQRYISTIQADDHIRVYEGNETWAQGDLVTTATAFHAHDFRCRTYDSIPNKIVFSGLRDTGFDDAIVATYDVVTDTWVDDTTNNAAWIFTGDEHDGYIYSLSLDVDDDAWKDSIVRCTPGNITDFDSWESITMPAWPYGGSFEYLYTIFGDYMYFNRHAASSYEWQNFKWNFVVADSPTFGDGNWTLIGSNSDSTEAPEDALIPYITANNYMVAVTNPYYNSGDPYWQLEYSTDGVTWGNVTTLPMQASITEEGWWEHFAIPTPYGPNAIYVQWLTEGKTTGYHRIFDLDGNILFCVSGRGCYSGGSDGNFLIDGDKFVLGAQATHGMNVQFSYLTQLYPPYFSNDPSTIALGSIYGGHTWYAHGNLTIPGFPLADGNCTFQLDNDATIAIAIDAYATDATGGEIYYLTDGEPGENEIRLTLLETGAVDATDGIILSNTGQEFIANIAISGHTHWEFKLETWSSNTDEVEKTVIIYLSSDEIVETIVITFTPESPDIIQTPSSWNVNPGDAVIASSIHSTSLDWGNLTNLSSFPIDVTIQGEDLCQPGDIYCWDLADDGLPASMVYALKAGSSSSTMTELGNWTGNVTNDEGYGVSLVADNNGHIYVGLDRDAGSPTVVKINRTTMETVGIYEAATGGHAYALAWDGTYIYAGLYCDPVEVHKIDPSAMTLVDSWTYPSEEYCYALLYKGGYLYAGLYGNTIGVFKIDASDMTTAGNWTGESSCFALETDGVYIYATDGGNPSHVYKINPETMATVGTWTGASGQKWSQALTWDGTYIYVGLKLSPSKVIKINITAMATEGDVWTGTTGQNALYTLDYDGVYVYLGLGVSLSKIIKLSPSTMTTAETYTSSAAAGYLWSMICDGGEVYFTNDVMNVVVMKLTSYPIIIRETAIFNLLTDNQAAGNSTFWGMTFYAPTSYDMPPSGDQLSGKVTLVAEAS